MQNKKFILAAAIVAVGIVIAFFAILHAPQTVSGVAPETAENAPAGQPGQNEENPVRATCAELGTGTATITLECASTPELGELGLSYRDSLAPNHGMLFLFNPPQSAGIWMKGMKFPLDILWLDQDFRIVTLKERISPDTYPTPFFPAKPVSYVIELPAGFAKAHQLSVGSVFEKKSVDNLPSSAADKASN